MSTTGDTGRAGEELAARYLMGKGCRILERNWRANPGEVDIIAECPSEDGSGEAVLAFVEVRTRHGRQGLAEESISGRKAASMASAASAYLEKKGLDYEATVWRIDLVAVAMQGERVGSVNWVRGIGFGE